MVSGVCVLSSCCSTWACWLCDVGVVVDVSLSSGIRESMYVLLHVIHCLMMWGGLRSNWSMLGWKMSQACGGIWSLKEYRYAASSFACSVEMVSSLSCVSVAVLHRSLQRRCRCVQISTNAPEIQLRLVSVSQSEER